MEKGPNNAGTEALEPALFRAAMSLHDKAPWKRFEDRNTFLVQVPGEPSPLAVSFLGAAGLQFGLAVVRGPRAWQQLSDLAMSEDPGADAMEVMDHMDTISCTFEKYREVPREFRRFYRTAGEKPRDGDVVPFFSAKPPHQLVRQLVRQEATALLILVNGLLKALREELIDPEVVCEADEPLNLILSGDPQAPEVRVTCKAPPQVPEEPPLQLVVDRELLETLPLIDATWLVACRVVPGEIQGSNEILRALLVMDSASGQMLDIHVAQGARAFYAAADHLFETFAGRGHAGVEGLPRQIRFVDQGLYQLAAPELEILGVKCRLSRKLPRKLRGAIDSLESFMATSPGSPGATSTGPADDRVPDPSDIQGWKAASHRLTERAVAIARRELLPQKRLSARYFGGASERDMILGTQRAETAMVSLIDWFWLDYRRKGKGRTVAEKMLAGAVPAAERMLIEAMVAVPTSLHRVVSVEPGRSLVLEDILRGGTAEVTDYAFSRSAKPDLVFPCRVFPAGNTHFMSNLGVPISPLMVGHALGFLEQEGLKTSPKALRAGAHLFGRLWAWMEQQPAFPRIHTTSGEPMVIHRGTFRLADRAAAEQAIAARKDVEEGGAPGRYIWNGPYTEALSGPVLLARLEITSDRLEVETNSDERWRRLCNWLQRIPGVTLLDVERTSPEDLLREPPCGPGEASMPGAEAGEDGAPGMDEQMDDETIAAISEHLRSIHLQWVDKPVPALGGQTPREAVRTAAGRRKVQQLIRTFPASFVGGSGITIDPPANEIRRLLGLPEE